jgi:hypothetical protein
MGVKIFADEGVYIIYFLFLSDPDEDSVVKLPNFYTRFIRGAGTDTDVDFHSVHENLFMFRSCRLSMMRALCYNIGFTSWERLAFLPG